MNKVLDILALMVVSFVFVLAAPFMMLGSIGLVPALITIWAMNRCGIAKWSQR